MCVYLGNNYVNGFSSLAPLLLVRLLLCSSPERAKLLSLFLFYHSFVAQFAGKHDVLFSHPGICQCGKRGEAVDRPTSAMPWDVFGVWRWMRELPTAAANM